MVLAAQPRSVSRSLSQAPLESPFPNNVLFNDLAGDHQIKSIYQANCTLVLITRHLATSTPLVIKILSAYQDTRYSLETLEQRQRSQLEALQQNRSFSPEVYCGLARVDSINTEQKFISIGEIIEYPTQEMLHPEREYALIMKQLPRENRLDYLLQEKEEVVLYKRIELLAKRVASVHDTLKGCYSDKDTTQWGSYAQIKGKLLHNFDLLNLILHVHKDMDAEAYSQLKSRLARLQEELCNKVEESTFKGYFEQRQAEQRIKHCHGDLKASNIWIVPEDNPGEQVVEENVFFLDAADFNLAYTNIDILSDLALLVVDIQARTGSETFANLLIEQYLRLTKQENEVARKILDYYLVEKAIVGAAISLVYDALPELGWTFLEIAEMRLHCLGEITTDRGNPPGAYTHARAQK